MQETALAAWQGIGSFEERASFRTWLYRVATNICLDARRAASRRPARAWDIPGFTPPEPTGYGEIHWLEPFPDGPEGTLERRESISLAFIKALQSLPPRQVAVLLLRDVIEFRARDVAEMLGTTVESVNSLLKRARAGLKRQSVSLEGPPPSPTLAEAELVEKFVRAYEAANVDAIVALLTEDAFMSMPPMALEYVGRDAVGTFLERFFGTGRRLELVGTRANGQPAFGMYLRTETVGRPGAGLLVLTLCGDRISALTRFDGSLLPVFALPLQR